MPIASKAVRWCPTPPRRAVWGVVGVCLGLIACRPEPTEARRADVAVTGTTDSIATDFTTTPTASTITLTGGGASLPYPLYAKWMNAYAVEHGVRLNYLSLGSAEGMDRLQAGRLDFAATDVPMADVDRNRGTIWQVPTAIAAVALTYHVPDTVRPIRFTPELIAGVLLGDITRWNDPRLRVVNPTVPLPDMPITVVHRGDGSGTTYILSDYLNRTSTAWRQRVGRGSRLAWPVGRAANGNEGVAATIRETPGSIGYVEVGYARLHRLPVAHLQNRQGRFISPMPFEIASAAAEALEDAMASRGFNDHVMIPPSASIVDADGLRSYPLASFTWILIPADRLGASKTRELLAFLRWALLEQEEVASRLGYVPLPASVAEPLLDQFERRIVP